ncbi:cyclic AMP response element-binding protein A isoform X2 [Musca domestica]|uniref:Cyclic AMP response element-binding protein A isoform X2 n=1 Tax=Musca domestica TaxID=7370 RepID=A0ABM3V2L8_MUSDO|nr:cyclic AMP response element-binding protein A isoform X2 [Musca domestica]
MPCKQSNIGGEIYWCVCSIILAMQLQHTTTDSLKLSTDSDMNDWFLERDVKDAAVILNDKLISDALLNGTLPIKSEHSYSLNSDGDSLPDSPHSLQAKMDDMEDECYPAISLKTATSNVRGLSSTATIDPKCLSITSSPAMLSGSNVGTGGLTLNPMVSAASTSSASLCSQSNPTLSSHGSTISHMSSMYGNVCKISASAPITLNLRNLDAAQSLSNALTACSSDNSKVMVRQPATQLHTQQLQQPQYLPQDELNVIMDNDCASSTSSRDGSQSPDICSDIEIDESCIKNEPMSPDSSCPGSPEASDLANSSSNTNGGTLSLTMANMAAFTNSDLVFEHKDGCLQLTPSSHNLLKSQQIILSPAQNVIIPKFTIKSETAASNGGTFITSPPIAKSYGLPLTPPSSLSSDGSEGNLTPEHMLSPQSPASSATARTAASVSQPTSGILTVTSIRRNTNNSSASSTTSNSSSTVSMGRHTNGGTTRQPIHTPLISSQPGSTGTLLLTEEEKRTLLAEGYPIPQKLPLTKAEEKSLKKIRRKIKNKISAQESRRKKKEYMDQLERKVEILVNENTDYKKRVKSLEDSNAGLLSQLHKLQAIVNKHNLKKS